MSSHSHDPHAVSAVCEAASLLVQQGCDVLGVAVLREPVRAI